MTRPAKMNPLMLQYLQGQQQQAGQPMPSSGGQFDSEAMTSPPTTPPVSYDPFSQGIEKAIAASKAATRMDEEQQADALANALNAAATMIGQTPLGAEQNPWVSALATGLNAGLPAYNQTEQNARTRNEAMMASLMKQQQSAQKERIANEFKRIALDQKNDLLKSNEDFKKESLRLREDEAHARREDRQDREKDKKMALFEKKWEKQYEKNKVKYDAAAAEQELLDAAEGILMKGGKENPNAEYGGLYRMFGGKPGFLQNEDQAVLNKITADLKGQAFKRFGYRNETEFKALKEIDPTLGIKQNLAIIKAHRNQIKPILAEKRKIEKLTGREDFEEGKTNSQAPAYVVGIDANGQEVDVAPEHMDAFRQNGGRLAS